MTPTKLAFALPLAVALVVAAGGCDKSNSSPRPAAPPDAAAAQGAALEREARDAAVAEVAKHWAKGADGWTTAITTGIPSSPDHYLRQFRDLSVHSVAVQDLDPSDRLNGLEWAGQVYFAQSPYREAGDPGLIADGMATLNVGRRRGAWTQWIDFQPEALRVRKVKGAWLVNPDSFLLRGKAPGPQDFTAAGVH